MIDLTERLARIREQIESACRTSGRPLDSVKLMAVTKAHPAEAAIAGYRAGLRLFGENRIQEFTAKKPLLSELSGARWHFIGHLQTNKAERAMELFDGIDVVDSLRLAELLNSLAEEKDRVLSVLLEVNVGGETQKPGFVPISRDFEALLRAAERLDHLEIRGLMIVPPYRPIAESGRPFFRMLRELRDDIARRGLPRVSMDELSMGMSHDFAIAVQEGSTCVRIGTAIFGERPKPVREFTA